MSAIITSHVEWGRRGIQPLPKSSDDLVVQAADSLSRHISEPVLGVGVPFGPITWILVGVGLLLGYRWLEILNADHDSVSVQVGKLSDATDSGRASDDVQAHLRRTLNTADVSTPTSIPGPPRQNLADTLEASSVTDGGWLAKLVAFLVRFAIPARGWEINGTVMARSEEKKCGIFVDVSEIRTRRPILVRIIWEDSHELAAETAARIIAQRALQQDRTVPRWRHWYDERADGLKSFLKGVELQSGGKYEDAEHEFRSALRIDGGNGMARLSLGQTLEQQEKFLEALQIYLHLDREHPQLLQARYRLGFPAVQV